ncbi:hypothetical protein C6558_36050 [Ensifer sp. NM-2]|uniref:hypothetical protein n=1 Tax=Ensifer sp. NM-2 TaxID=2109730 RepID=UPI000D1347F7|nr:hypothetical protein [Ensifer sp. NM-2]PSS59839.1 hypothetical protein C6558_36050 [Ensifer sp. NM-2]
MVYSAVVVTNGNGEWFEGDMFETMAFVSKMAGMPTEDAGGMIFRAHRRGHTNWSFSGSEIYIEIRS